MPQFTRKKLLAIGILGVAMFAASYIILWWTISACCVVAFAAAIDRDDDQHDRAPYFTDMEAVIDWPLYLWQVVLSRNYFRCTNEYRMSGTMVTKLYRLLRKDLKGTKKCPKHHQVLIFLDWIAFGTTYRLATD